jgi:hypothetical protein
MGRERVLTPVLGVFLSLVGGVMLSALDSRWRRPDLASALALLADGDLEGVERRRILGIVLAEGRGRQERPPRVAAAAAALLLGDQSAFDYLAARLAEGGACLRSGDLVAVERLVAAEPVLTHLFAGIAAEGRGERVAAHAAFDRAATAAELWNMPLAKAVAVAGGDRTR